MADWLARRDDSRLNGIDYEQFDPATDRVLAVQNAYA